MAVKHTTVDGYLGDFEGEVSHRLKQLREMVQTTVPEAVESIAYGMPAYKFKGKPLVYFAGYAHHIGVYATPVTHEAFAKSLRGYKQGKGSVQFPLSEPLPVDLIKQMILFRKNELG
ncbi:MAG: DUF1801 domain-containing protein [Flavobacteriales bacterium]|nr:DUF1801 domain-containing protein [Flavobacteriales bacterium]